MDKYKLLILVVSLILTFLTTKLIFDFLDISFSSYAIYLYWILAVFLFVAVLPKRTGLMFT
jgi:hypothetical protein